MTGARLHFLASLIFDRKNYLCLERGLSEEGAMPNLRWNERVK